MMNIFLLVLFLGISGFMLGYGLTFAGKISPFVWAIPVGLFVMAPMAILGIYAGFQMHGLGGQ